MRVCQAACHAGIVGLLAVNSHKFLCVFPQHITEVQMLVHTSSRSAHQVGGTGLCTTEASQSCRTAHTLTLPLGLTKGHNLHV